MYIDDFDTAIREIEVPKGDVEESLHEVLIDPYKSPIVTTV